MNTLMGNTGNASMGNQMGNMGNNNMANNNIVNNPMGAVSGNLFNASANSGQPKMMGGRRRRGRKATRKGRKATRKGRKSRSTRRR